MWLAYSQPRAEESDFNQDDLNHFQFSLKSNGRNLPKLGTPNNVWAIRGQLEGRDSRQSVTQIDPAFLCGWSLTLSEVCHAKVSNKFIRRELKRSRLTGEPTSTSFSPWKRDLHPELWKRLLHFGKMAQVKRIMRKVGQQCRGMHDGAAKYWSWNSRFISTKFAWRFSGNSSDIYNYWER